MRYHVIQSGNWNGARDQVRELEGGGGGGGGAVDRYLSIPV